MLMSLRRSVNKSVVKYLLFGVLILSFGVWGVADLFIPSDGANEVIMTAGEREFTYAEVERSYRQELRLLQVDVRTADTALLQRVLDYTLEQLANSALNSQEVENLNIQGARTLVLNEIRNNENFHDVFGKFDERLFIRFLGFSGLSEEEYIGLIAQDIGAQYWLRGLQASVAVPQGLAKVYGNYLRQLRQVDYVEIKYNNVKAAALSEQDMQKHYNDNLENYRVPELRKFLLVNISLESLADEIIPDEQEIRNLYNSGAYNIDTPERRDIRFLVFGDESSATEIYEALQGGSDIGEVDTSAEVQALQGQTNESIADRILSDRAFALQKVGDISEPFEGTFGWVVLQLDKIEVSKVATFEEMRSEILADIVGDRGAEIIYDKAQGLEESVNGGASLTEAAADIGLPIEVKTSTDNLSADIIAETFDLSIGEVSTLIEQQNNGNSDSFFMVELQDIEPSHIADFASVKETIRKDIIMQEKINKLQQSAELVKSGQSNLAEFATLWGGKISQAEVSLNAGDDYPAVLNDSGFRHNAVGWVADFPTADSFILGRLQKISLKPLEDGQDNIGENIIGRLMQNMTVAAYEKLLRNKYKITYNRDALSNIIIGNDILAGQR